jgi:hypothetical protein
VWCFRGSPPGRRADRSRRDRDARPVRTAAPRSGVRRDRRERRRAADALQGPRDDRLGARRAAPAESPRNLAIAHCRYSTTGSTVWENAQPTYRQGPRRAIAIGHNGNLVNTRELLGQLAGGRARLPCIDGHGAPDRAPGRRTRRGHRGGVAARPAACPGRLRARGPRRQACHRRSRPARVPTARPRQAPRERAKAGRPERRRPLERGRDRLVSLVGDCRARHRRCEYVRDVEPGEIVVLEPGQAPRSIRYAEADPPCVSSSSSTSRDRTRTWRVATCTRRAGGWASSSPSSIPSTPTS